ncbi:hypothetical protein UlMin_031455 [Ulmus minor]
MAPNALQISIVLFLVTTFFHGTRAQVSCTRVLISLSPCLNYVTGNSTAPSSSCCSQLANVVGSQPQCLCSVLNGGASSLGVTINQTQAMSLPSACNVKTPPVSQCNSANGPSASSPLTSPPADTSDETPDDQPPISSEEPTFQSGTFRYSTSLDPNIK